MSLKKTTEQFIQESKEVHGEKYDYSKVEYINCKTKVCIICPEHGEFWQRPKNHIHRKQGCHKCCKTGVKYETNAFIKLIEKKFGNKIIIPNDFIYINSHTKSRFICPIHGEFYQRPNDLLNGHLCPTCGLSKSKEQKSLNNITFIKKAKQIHQNNYNYQKVDYQGYDTKVCIICPEHGEFYQTPHSHLYGNGCPKCKMSNLERRIYNELSKNDIKFIYEQKFDWLGQQSLDFYLPDYNIAIECQGIQHFIPCNFGSQLKTKQEMFEYISERDIIKYNLCVKNNIDLIYFHEYKLNMSVLNKTKYFKNKKEIIKYILNSKKKQYEIQPI